MRGKMLGTLVLSVLLAASIAWFLGGEEQHVGADPTLSIGVDANTAGNDSTSLGPIDACRSVNTNDTFDVDIFVKDVVDLVALDVYFTYDPAVLNVVGLDVSPFLAANEGSNVLNLSDAVPDSSGIFNVGAADIADPVTHDTGEGVLARLTLKAVGPGTSPAGVPLGTGFGPTLKDLNANILGDSNGDGYFDGPNLGAQIAVDQPCGASTPTPTPTSTPSATPEASPSPSVTSTPLSSPTATPTPPMPTPTPSPGTVILAAGWNDTCYQGTARPIGDALADLAGHVAAVYRMRPNQGFDHWFPTRPDLSTISDLYPYDQLFILSSEPAVWTHEPVSPPASASLASGWNGVCYPGPDSEVESATASITGKFALLYTLAPDQAWRRFVPGRPEASNLPLLRSRTSVLVLVTDPGGAQWVFGP